MRAAPAARRSAEAVLQAGVLLVLSAYLAFPLAQGLRHGYVFYTNGQDEATYLSYEVSSRAQDVTRLSSYLVTWLHEIGLAGGAVNLLLDAAFVLVAALLLPRIVRRLAPAAPPTDRAFAVLLVVLVPHLLTQLNPVMSRLRQAVEASPALTYFVIYPHGNDPIYLRSPESQASLIALIVLAWALVRAGKLPWIVLAVPFLYFFLGIVVAAVWLVYHGAGALRSRAAAAPAAACLLAGTAALLLLAAGQWVLYTVFDPGRLLLRSHAPLLGLALAFLAALCVAALAAGARIGLAGPPALFVGACLVAAVAVYNTQLVNGMIAQPQHFEFEVALLAGVVAAVIALAALRDRPPAVRAAAWLLAGGVLLLSHARYVRTNWVANAKATAELEALRLQPGFAADLERDPARVAVDGIGVSTRLSGLYLVRGATLATGVDNVFMADDERYGRFLDLAACARQRGDEVAARMAPVLEQLDERFSHQYDDFLPLYRARRPAHVYTYENVPRQRAPECSLFRFYLLPAGSPASH